MDSLTVSRSKLINTKRKKVEKEVLEEEERLKRRGREKTPQWCNSSGCVVVVLFVRCSVHLHYHLSPTSFSDMACNNQNCTQSIAEDSTIEGSGNAVSTVLTCFVRLLVFWLFSMALTANPDLCLRSSCSVFSLVGFTDQHFGLFVLCDFKSRV